MKWEMVGGHLALERLQQSMAALIGRMDPAHASQAMDKVERTAFSES